jgi:hypothetical protein
LCPLAEMDAAAPCAAGSTNLSGTNLVARRAPAGRKPGTVFDNPEALLASWNHGAKSRQIPALGGYFFCLVPSGGDGRCRARRGGFDKFVGNKFGRPKGARRAKTINQSRFTTS